jgi:hypothetical protein
VHAGGKEESEHLWRREGDETKWRRERENEYVTENETLSKYNNDSDNTNMMLAVGIVM